MELAGVPDAVQRRRTLTRGQIVVGDGIYLGLRALLRAHPEALAGVSSVIATPMITDVAPLKALKQVLLVEDNPDEERLALRALKSVGLPLDVVVLRDGHEALQHIARLEAEADAQIPSLVLLDLKLPKVGGIEVLRRLREGDRFRHVPVVVCSSSDEESDVASSMALGANEYLRKSVDYAQFSDSIRRVADVWLRP